MRRCCHPVPNLTGLCCLLLFLLLLAGGAGCGGSEGGSTQEPGETEAQTGAASLTVQWPADSRLVPFAANSIRVRVSKGASVLGEQVLVRPAGGGTATAAFSRLPVGEVIVTASAHPNPDGTGNPQAQAQTPVTIRANETASVHLTMASRIDRLEISPSADLHLFVGRERELIPTARDAAGNVVFILPATLQWASSAPAIAYVGGGMVTAAGAGTAQITVTETESGKSAAVNVTVEAEPAPVSWWKAEGSALDATDGNHGILHNGATFGPGVSPQAFVFDGVDDAIHVPDAENLKITNSLTIDAWVNAKSYPTPAAVWSTIVFRGDSREGYDPYFLHLRHDGRVYFEIETANAEKASVSAPFPLNRWVHVTATLDGATGMMRLYLDGGLITEAFTPVRPLRDLDPAFSPGIGIGNHSGFPDSAYNFPFHGSIDEVKIYDRPVPPTPVE